jgi:excisionase family DNA binding protein
MSSMHALKTGEVARYCAVNFRTVIRWIERGLLRAYKLPGRGDHRIRVDDFVAFLRDNDMPVPPEFDRSSSRVLIVDDEVAMARSIQRVLRDRGYETALAHDGFAAGSLVETYRPVLMTLDLRMPGMGGIDVIRRIREGSRGGGLKILVVSAMPEEDLKEAMAQGADAVLAKPFDNDELARKVAALIGRPAVTAASSA